MLAQLPPVSPVDLLRHPSWEKKGFFIGGGTSVASTPSGSNFLFGVRIGRILTEEHGRGILRGTFELAGDIIPVDEYWINGGQYSGGIDPVVLKWNFTATWLYLGTLRSRGRRRAFQQSQSSSRRYRASQFHQRSRGRSPDVSQRHELVEPIREAISLVQRIHRQSQSWTERESAICAGL